jgi:hypothetical protein
MFVQQALKHTVQHQIASHSSLIRTILNHYLENTFALYQEGSKPSLMKRYTQHQNNITKKRVNNKNVSEPKSQQEEIPVPVH